MSIEDRIIKSLYISLIEDGIPGEIANAIIKNLISENDKNKTNINCLVI